MQWCRKGTKAVDDPSWIILVEKRYSIYIIRAHNASGMEKISLLTVFYYYTQKVSCFDIYTWEEGGGGGGEVWCTLGKTKVNFENNM